MRTRCLLLPLLLGPLLVGACSDEKAPEKRVLRSSLAGSWYPADAAELAADLDGYLQAAHAEPDPAVRALVLPHAGYRWSGGVAACGVARVKGRHFSRVVVMGPSHHARLANRISVPAYTHYETPLGEVELDRALIEKLERHAVFEEVPRIHEGEHSVQIQVPLLQRALGSFRLVPLVVGDLDPETAKRAAAILLSLIDADTLVVASSDFTHYGPRFDYLPFEEDVPDRVKALDMGAFAAIQKHDADAFVRTVNETRATICGRRPIEILLRMLPEKADVTLCRYDTSGRIGRDWTNSVSYLGAAIATVWPEREEPEREEHPVESTKDKLTREEKTALLRLAHEALAFALADKDVPSPADLGVTLTPRLERDGSAFVTLRHSGDLRGCIGEIHPVRPLWRSVMGSAVAAAQRDWRFRHVTLGELPHLDISISVLTPPHPVSGWQDIELGRHGIVLQKNGHTATFLPQVAPEQGWDLDQTLTQLALKAGLPADAWYEGATFLVFEAEVFGTSDE